MEKDGKSSLGRGNKQSGFGIPPALEMNLVDYLPDLNGFDLSEAEKLSLLQTLWDIMRAFVELGVDVGREDICGRILGDESGEENHSADDVKSSFSKATETNSHDRRKEPTA